MESPNFIFDRAQKAAERAAQKNIVARHTHKHHAVGGVECSARRPPPRPTSQSIKKSHKRAGAEFRDFPFGFGPLAAMSRRRAARVEMAKPPLSSSCTVMLNSNALCGARSLTCGRRSCRWRGSGGDFNAGFITPRLSEDGRRESGAAHMLAPAHRTAFPTGGETHSREVERADYRLLARDARRLASSTCEQKQRAYLSLSRGLFQ
jgi:hypothetical protein